jgi:membrane-associated protease RseP (regulator of RpoE activity)
MALALTIVVIVIILNAVVILHELGHYWAAKLYKITPESFSVGFGPEMFGRTDKNGTRWKVSWIPLGGYVKLRSDDDTGMGMIGLVPWHGFALITIAGCLVNYLTAWVFLIAITGQPWIMFRLTGATIAGLPPGVVDTFTAPGTDTTLAGPIGIVDILSADPKLLIIAFPVISLSLAIINMVPIPMLDGGHLVFGSIEHIRGKQFGEKTSFALTFVSLFAVLMLFAFTTFSDIARL